MTDRQLFGVLVRVFGFVFVYEAIFNVNVGVAQLLDPTVYHRFPARFDFAFAVIESLLAFAFIHWPGWVVCLAYGSDSN
jgi:hypothetical protein